MAYQPRKPSRLAIAIIESLFLSCLSAPAAFAASPVAAEAAVANRSAPDSTAALDTDPADALASIGATDLYLETVLNGTDRGLAHFGDHDGQLWATLATLRQLGFDPPAGTPDPVRVDGLPGVKVNFDREHQSVDIVAPLALLHLSTYHLGNRPSTLPHASASPGLLLNYNLYGTRSGQGNDSLSAFTELRAFSGRGIFSSTELMQALRTNDTWSSHSIRLDTSWSTSFPSRMLTLRLGDTLTSATTWSRSTRVGGIQIGTDFALQPYFVTTPLPEFFGSATLPSQVQLYINGMQQYSGKVPAGPFQLNAVPGISGAGNAQVVLTDALGRVTTLNFSLYNTTQLLRQGLTEWSAELGFVRENYGLSSFDYGSNPMASGTWRHGFSNNLTGEMHAEATNGLLDGGVGGDWLLGTSGGVVNGSVAHSRYHGLSGSQVSLGYHWANDRLNFGFDAIRASDGYRDVASMYGAPPPRLTANAQVGFNAFRFGSLGVGYTQLNYQQQTSRYASAYWFQSLGRRASVNLNVNQDLEQSRDRSIFFTFSMSLDDRDFLSTGLQHQGTRNLATVDVNRSIPAAGGWGWRAQLQQGGDVHNGQAELDYLGNYGYAQAGVNDFSGDTSAYAGANGSLVWMAGHLFAARQVTNGFAVVSTNGLPNVPVKLENNLVGATNRDGLLLVTPLNAYQENRLSIDPMSLPADMRINTVNEDAVPTDRAGTLVHFGITPVRAASVILVDATGKPLPLGSTARIHGQSGEPALVGFDGAVYLDTLEAHNVLDVETPSGACHVAFNYHKQGGGIPQIGPLTCRKEASP
jgi:outer membrane usher protein